MYQEWMSGFSLDAIKKVCKGDIDSLGHCFTWELTPEKELFWTRIYSGKDPLTGIILNRLLKMATDYQAWQESLDEDIEDGEEGEDDNL